MYLFQNYKEKQYHIIMEQFSIEINEKSKFYKYRQKYEKVEIQIFTEKSIINMISEFPQRMEDSSIKINFDDKYEILQMFKVIKDEKS